MHLNPRLTHRFYCRRQKGSAEQFPPEVIASAAKQSSFLLSRGFLYCHVASLLSMNLSLGAAFCVEACALDRCGCFHRPAAGEALFGAEKSRKRLAPDRTHAQLLLRLCPALLSECGPAPTRASTPTPASMPSVAARPRSLCSLRLHFAATRLARSNNGALLPHSAAMLGVLYRALSHLARASLRYSSAFLFHPTDMSQCAVVARVEAQRVEARGTA